VGVDVGTDVSVIAGVCEAVGGRTAVAVTVSVAGCVGTAADVREGAIVSTAGGRVAVGTVVLIGGSGVCVVSGVDVRTIVGAGVIGKIWFATGCPKTAEAIVHANKMKATTNHCRAVVMRDWRVR
jgi:hypothetical protein